MPYIKGCMPSKYSLLLMLFACALVSLVITACVFMRSRDVMSVAVSNGGIRMGEFVDGDAGEFIDDGRVSSEGTVSGEEVRDSRVHPTVKESNEHSAAAQGMVSGDCVVSENDAQVEESVDGNDAQFEESVDGNDAQFEETVDGNDAQFEESVDGNDAQFEESVDGNDAQFEETVDGNDADQGNCCIDRSGNEQILENEEEVQPESASPSKLSLPNGRECSAPELPIWACDVRSRESAHHCSDDDLDIEFFTQLSLYMINQINSMNKSIGTGSDVPVDIAKNVFERVNEFRKHLQYRVDESAAQRSAYQARMSLMRS
ncbi:hypothetical protein VCUG_01193 [Vavraia culicis subsp. floridensis]|uniref:Uncharacterized protein n=1 Tax=Vavraia culicis (isolate floridensis) TaxID=948595 RepID=L2GUK2_VAVCU|nr:uncharacterized protein VCUG_01193 [Vavraia culicis subsp. floridensis]ELA47309.1 hypothetical protein VCUG_01193 [Vavraia culicis subsp. floridensis]